MTEFDNGKRRLLLATVAGATYLFNAKAANAINNPDEVLTFQSTIRLHTYTQKKRSE